MYRALARLCAFTGLGPGCIWGRALGGWQVGPGAVAQPRSRHCPSEGVRCKAEICTVKYLRRSARVESVDIPPCRRGGKSYDVFCGPPDTKVLYYTPARVNGTWSDQHQAFVLHPTQLPFFVDSEWNLVAGRTPGSPPRSGGEGLGTSPEACGGSQVTGLAGMGGEDEGGGGEVLLGAKSRAAEASALLEPHVLQFLVYVPPPGSRPLKVLDAAGSLSQVDSFWIPSWGGVTIWNPPGGALAEEGVEGGACDTPGGDGLSCGVLTYGQMQAVAGLMAAQLRSLLGLPDIALLGVPPVSSARSALDDLSVSGAPSAQDSQAAVAARGGGEVGVQGPLLAFLPAPSRGFALWEVELLVRQRTARDVSEAGRVLSSLSRLVLELPNLEMPDLIGQQASFVAWGAGLRLLSSVVKPPMLLRLIDLLYTVQRMTRHLCR